MSKTDRKPKAEQPRVLTDADFETPARGGLHHKTRERMLRTGEAVLPADFYEQLQRGIEAEIGPPRPRDDSIRPPQRPKGVTLH